MQCGTMLSGGHAELQSCWETDQLATK